MGHITAQVDVYSKLDMGKIRVRRSGNETEGICTRFLITTKKYGCVWQIVWLAFFHALALLLARFLLPLKNKKGQRFKCGETTTLT